MNAPGLHRRQAQNGCAAAWKLAALMGESGAGRGLGFTGDSWRRCGRVISESILDGGISRQLWACFSRRSRENGILKVCGGSTAEQA